MSRIGIRPVLLPSGVSADVRGDVVTVKGPKGELQVTLLPEITVTVDGGRIAVARKDDSDKSKARHGLLRVLIANAAQGVSQGYEKKLEIIGVGYKAQVKGKNLLLNLGHSHPIEFPIPAGIDVSQEEKNKNVLNIRGIDKQLVGQMAAQIRSLRRPEPYKGKGIRYMGENVRRKAGKAAAAKTGAAA